MASAPMAYFTFAASHYDDAESAEDLQDPIIAASGTSALAKDQTTAHCPMYKEIIQSSHDIHCHPKIAESIWRDCQPCNGSYPADLNSRKCTECGKLQVTCWLTHLRNAEQCSDRLPAFIDQALQQCVNEERADDSDINSTSTQFPRSPLHAAALLGFSALTSIYLSMSYNPNALAHLGGQTALHMATASAQLPIVRLLLAWGADLEARTGITGRTPLQIAAFRGHLDVCKLLLENGASLEAKDSRGKTSVELAQSSGHTETAEFLLEAGMRHINLDVKAKPQLEAPAVKQAAVLPPPISASPVIIAQIESSSSGDWSDESSSEGDSETHSATSDDSESWDELSAESDHLSSIG